MTAQNAGPHDGRVHLARQLEEARGAVVYLPRAHLDLEERVGAAVKLHGYGFRNDAYE